MRVRPEPGFLAVCAAVLLAAVLTTGCERGHAPPEPAATSSAPAPSLPSGGGSRAPHAPNSGSVPTSASASAAPASLDAFVGSWVGHGRSLVVAADGTGTISARAYQNCGDPDVTGPCDTFEGDQIKPGAVTKIKITAAKEARGGAVADFAVVESTLSLPSGSTGAFTLDQARDALSVAINGTSGDGYYCGPKAEPGFCGA